MTKSFVFFFFSIVVVGWSQEKKSAVTTDDYFKILRETITGEKAYETTAFVSQYWRVVGNEGFNKSIFKVASELEAAGYVQETNATILDRFTYRIEKRSLQHPTWEPVSAEVSLVGSASPLLKQATNRNMVYLNSASTPSNGVVGEVVYIKDLGALKNSPVRGKIIYTDANRVSEIYKEGVLNNGALGMFSYNNPGYLKPEINTTSIQFRSLPYHPNNKWAIALSYEAKETLKSAMDKGTVRAKVNVATKLYPSEELTLVADVRGSETPGERLVFSAHVQEPGANDNASGVGAQLEMAITTAKLIASDAIDAYRSISFLWGDEIISTNRYIVEDEERAKSIKWGISLDMVGENTSITGGTFLIEKMPDPSAIWTRGEDQHSEWGGRVLRLEDMKPHYLNDFMIHNFKNQGEFANWVVKTNPYEGGSDHMPFLKADIPGLLLWHFTDQFYHTDNDTMDKVSQETLRNVSTAALASALTLVNGDSYTATAIIDLMKDAATNRLAAEFLLSERAVKKGASSEEEQQIIKAWTDWYIKTIDSTRDMANPGNTAIVEKAILSARSIIEMQSDSFISELKRK
ncbi:M28 family peptidase [Arenibacter certesii]|uniref:Aminopeptidase family M28 protein n=1 Tax=Arenibacter certesii TaxID=228955 RepID=A0A918IZZ6_9FLAO|nr:M28 family peptidase [Arenibacter certesii]GGW38711.1 aminopeptidase family M28 protein [Arenibacter certesii]